MTRRSAPASALVFASCLAACGAPTLAPEDSSRADSGPSSIDAVAPPIDARSNAPDASPDHVEVDAMVPARDAAADAATLDTDATLAVDVDAGARGGEIVVRASSINGVAVHYISGDDFFVLYALSDGGQSEVRLVRTNGYSSFSTTVLARAAHPNLAVSSGSLAFDAGLRAAWYNGAGGIDVVALDAEGRVTARLPRSLEQSAGMRNNRLALALSMNDVVFEGTSRGETVVRRSVFDLFGGSAAAPRMGTVGDERQRPLPTDVRSLAIGPYAYAYTRSSSGTAYVQWVADWASATPPVLEVRGVAGPARVQSITGQDWGGELDLTIATMGDAVSQHRARFSRFSSAGTASIPATLVASDASRTSNEAAVLTANQSANGATGVAWSSDNERIYWRAFDPSDTAPCLVTSLSGATWRGFSLAQRGARNKLFAAIATVADRGGPSRDELHLWHIGDGEGLCGL